MAKSFTPEEMESIRKNPNTWTVTSKRISLTKAAEGFSETTLAIKHIRDDFSLTLR